MKTKKVLTSSQKLLERLRTAHGGCSDYRLAKILGITQSAISIVKKKGTTFSDVTLNKIAQELNENPMLLIANYHLETQDFPGMNNVWEEMKRLSELEEINKFQTVTHDGIGKVSGL